MRSSANSEVAAVSAALVESGHRTITFCASRKGTELIAADISRRVPSHLKRTVMSYRAGYLAEERRAIEEQMSDGTLRGIVATSALELGVDIGDLGHRKPVLSERRGVDEVHGDLPGRRVRCYVRHATVAACLKNRQDPSMWWPRTWRRSTTETPIALRHMSAMTSPTDTRRRSGARATGEMPTASAFPASLRA